MDWPQPDGVRPRGSLIFAGGRGDFIEKYLEALGHWHARGWQVTSFDWRGQGASAAPGAAAASLDPLVDDFAALLGDWRAAGRGLTSRSATRWADICCCGPSSSARRGSTPRCWSRR